MKQVLNIFVFLFSLQSFTNFAQDVGSEDISFDKNEFIDNMPRNTFKLINLTKREIGFVIFSCSYSSWGPFSTTHCHEEMFTKYPHRIYSYESVFRQNPYHIYIPFLEVKLPENPVLIKSLSPAITKPKTTLFGIADSYQRMIPFQREILSKWVYVTVYNKSDECKDGNRFKGDLTYSGKWTHSYTQNTEGWLSPDAYDNPNMIVIRSAGKDPCNFMIEGI